MKNLLSCLFAILIATACSSDPLEPEFRITGSNFELMCEGGDITVDVIHNVSYRISIDGNWITQNQSKGSSSGKVVFSVAENPTNDLRKGTITFTSEDAGVTAAVNVSQHGRFEIYYTTRKNAAITLKDTGVFGAEVLSNTYAEGKGTIKFSGPVTQIGDKAFYTREISSIDLPNTVTRIGNSAFYGCESLKTLEIPNSVTAIDEGAFNWCTSLERISLPDSLKVIKDKTFYDCGSLKGISLPEGLAEIGNYAFYNCFGLTGITIPGSVTTIGAGAFTACTGLKEIKVPAGVKTIESNTFAACTSLAAVELPGSITTISKAFDGCSALTSMKCLATNPPALVMPEMMSGTYEFNLPGLKIYVPQSSLEAYKNADVWKEHADMIFPIE